MARFTGHYGNTFTDADAYADTACVHAGTLARWHAGLYPDTHETEYPDVCKAIDYEEFIGAMHDSKVEDCFMHNYVEDAIQALREDGLIA